MLEERSLLSVGPVGGEFKVNTTTTNDQRDWPNNPSSVAMDADGDFVATWASLNQDGDGWGVYAQRYDETGAAQGSEFRVNTTTALSQYGPAVAMDADGDFVVTWESYQDPDGSRGIYGQRYNAAGVAQGNEFRVNTTTADIQVDPVPAMNAAGNFVVTWTSYNQDGSSGGIYARRYDADGVPQGAEFRLNTTTAGLQSLSRVAMGAVGDFVVTWSCYGQVGSKIGIYAQRYNEQGGAQGSEFRVNSFRTDDQHFSTVAMDARGNFVVAWHSSGQDGSGNGIYAQRYNAAGIALGPEFRVNTTTADSQEYPAVAMGAAGNFTVTWLSVNQDGSGYGVYAQQYNATGVAQGSEFLVNTTTANDQAYASIASDADGNFVIDWSSQGQDGSGWGIYAQRYGGATHTIGPVVGGVYMAGDSHAITEGERLVSEIPQLAVSFSRDIWTTGGATGANSVTNPANWQLTRTGKDISNTIGGITFGLNSATGHYEALLNLTIPLETGHYVLTAKGSIQDASGVALDGNHDTLPGDNFSRSFAIANIGAVGQEFRVNTYTTSTQALPAVAVGANGDFVVAWESWNQDGSSWGIYAQRYSAAGVPQGGEFRVNTYTTSGQLRPSVAIGANGDFVIAWDSFPQDGIDSGVYAQRYNAVGVPQGGEFLVNTFTTGEQAYPSVVMGANGDFVIAWTSWNQDGSGFGVYAQRYNAAGVAQGSEFLVNTYTTNNQWGPSVAMGASGDFVIAWHSDGQDGSSYGIYAQRYNAVGVRQGGEFRVNTYTTDWQYGPSVDMGADGDFVIAWYSVGPDGSDSSIQAQRYAEVNSRPMAEAGGPYAVGEGSTAALDASGTFDPDQTANTLTYQWDLDGDGLFGETGAAAANGDEMGMSPTFKATGVDGLAYVQVSLRATDSAGATDTDDATITIDNVPPTATLSNSGVAPPGQAVTVTFSGASDPSSADTAAGFHYSYALSAAGLATTYAAATDGTSKQFTFATAGSYPVYGRTFDKDNGYTDYTTTVVVTNNVAPTATLGNNGPRAEGSTGTVTFSNQYDPSPSDTAAGFHYAYDFNNDGAFEVGDGTYPGGTTAASATVPATYLDDGPGTRIVKGRILDVQGGYNDYLTTITINNAPPTATLSNSGPVDQSAAVTVSFSNAGDSSSADRNAGFRYSIALDSASLAASYAAAGSSATAQFTFNNPGTVPVYGRIFDKDNGSTDYQTPVQVRDITPPTINGASSTAADGMYTVGAVIPIVVAFSKPVSVTGIPGLLLETGTTDAWANYVSGSGTSALVFNYTVAVGQLSPDLDCVSSSAMTLNGGTIRDAAGNNAVLTLPNPGAAGSLGAGKNLVIDTVQPTAALADPLNGGSIWDRTIGTRGYIDVTLSDVGPSGLDVAAVLAGGPVFTLSGPAASGVTVNGSPQQISATTFRYSFTGRFTPGAAGVSFIAGSFHDKAGNANPAGAGLGFNVVRTVAVSDAAAVTERSTGRVYASFLVDLYWPNDQPVTVQYVTGGSAPNTVAAVPGRDYTAAKGTLTFKPGQTAKTVKVLVRDDKIYEDTETFLVSLTNPKGAGAVVAQGVATATILDNDPPPRILLKDVTISEGNWLNVTVSLSAASGKPVSVHYATADGTATAGIDYAAIPDTLLTFAPGETKKTFRVSTLQDQLYEGNEKFVVNFTNPQNATLSRPSFTCTIKDNDPKPKGTALARLASPALAIDEAIRTLSRGEAFWHKKEKTAILLFEAE